LLLVFYRLHLFMEVCYDGDVSYGRLSAIPFPEKLEWWYLLAPIALLAITRFGIPVSTNVYDFKYFFRRVMIIEKMN